jgi:chromosome segregation ATPase
MLKVSPSSYRKGALVFALAAMLALFGASGETSAKNKKSNPSDQGLANGIAHRVAALEEIVGETNDAIAMLIETVAELQAQVNELTDANADLEVRVDDLELQVNDLELRVQDLEAQVSAGT